MILKCFCDATTRGGTRGAEYQNREHGAHKRVHNRMPKTQSMPQGGYRCTVCGRTQTKN